MASGKEIRLAAAGFIIAGSLGIGGFSGYKYYEGYAEQNRSQETISQLDKELQTAAEYLKEIKASEVPTGSGKSISIPHVPPKPVESRDELEKVRDQLKSWGENQGIISNVETIEESLPKNNSDTNTDETFALQRLLISRVAQTIATNDSESNIAKKLFEAKLQQVKAGIGMGIAVLTRSAYSQLRIMYPF